MSMFSFVVLPHGSVLDGEFMTSSEPRGPRHLYRVCAIFPQIANTPLEPKLTLPYPLSSLPLCRSIPSAMYYNNDAGRSVALTM